ncbi:uncharacterized protein B0H18DRAFT_1174574 [Fomitopsis serialis]|uniref:uncharacterized protein n=1 Tax=Fomitopsis serialis TaxID=139415 RepID=UPI002008E7A6|nr:uncharacterized protein B0H18DRAFT_1174574 [Neoantrodia serialis]KAH9935636.1 hypothetical protein B0H18DRAFT_1174574 [Neoantrodia serialis]
MPAVSLPASPVIGAETSQQSEQATLHGQRALTPLISGAVSGGTIGILWIVRSAGLRNHRELAIPPPKPRRTSSRQTRIIQGFRIPGERVVPATPAQAQRQAETCEDCALDTGREERAEKQNEKGKAAESKPEDVGQVKSAPQLPTLQELPSPTLSPALSPQDRLSARSLSPRSTHPHDS